MSCSRRWAGDRPASAKAREWKPVPMLARTHGQPASPTSWARRSTSLSNGLNVQLAQLKRVPFSAKFGAATGNLNAHTRPTRLSTGMRLRRPGQQCPGAFALAHDHPDRALRQPGRLLRQPAPDQHPSWSTSTGTSGPTSPWTTSSRRSRPARWVIRHAPQGQPH